jgi:hypothetical protein
VKQKEASIARLRRCEHFSVATNQHAEIEQVLDAVFYMWSALRLYRGDQREKLVSWRSESVVSSLDLHF